MRRLALIAGAIVVAITTTAAASPVKQQEASPAPPVIAINFVAPPVPVMPVALVPNTVPTTTSTLVITAPPPPAKTSVGPAPVPIPATAPPSVAFAEYVRALRALPPDALIRHVWRDRPRDGERMVQIARRESGLRCNAKNRYSSASGLFQHLSMHAGRANRMGLSWSDVAGPDCVADTLLARAMWNESGYGPWRLTA